MPRPLHLLLCALLLDIAFASESPSVHYTLSLQDRSEQLIKVRMSVSPLPPGQLKIALPAWNNLYQIRDFSRFVRDLKAYSENGTRLDVRQADKQTWVIQTGGGLLIEYGVNAVTPGPFGAELDAFHAFLSPALICMYLPDFRDVEHRIRLVDVPAEWRIVSGLPRQNGDFVAEDYDHLVDSPIETGKFELETFVQNGVTYEIVVDGRRGAFELTGFVDMIQKIVEYEVSLMGQPPFSRYVFIYHVSDNGSGGMEHRNSTAIGLSRSAVSGTPRAAAWVTAHEFFHLWNVKRIRPSEFDRMDWSREVHTRSLWFSEGTTSYYTGLTLLRSGLISEDEFLDDLSEQISTLQSRESRLWKSVEQASWDTWFDRYPGYSLPANSISYYNKGALVSFLLDLRIRAATGNRRSLDDMLRFMNVWFGSRDVGFSSDDLRRAAESVALSNFESFFNDFVSGTQELPFEQDLALAGLEISDEGQVEFTPGFSLQRADEAEAWRVTGILPRAPALAAGLELDDIVRLFDGSAAPDEATYLELFRSGKGVELRGSRGDESKVWRIEPLQKRIPSYRVRRQKELNAEQLEVWLGLTRGLPAPAGDLKAVSPRERTR